MSRFKLPIKELLVASALALSVGTAAAKLPVPPVTPESQAKAEETKAKTAEAAKKAAAGLAAAQDKAVANYQSHAKK